MLGRERKGRGGGGGGRRERGRRKGEKRHIGRRHVDYKDTTISNLVIIC